MFGTNIYGTTQYGSTYQGYISIIVVDSGNSIYSLQLDQTSVSNNNILQGVTGIILSSLEQSISCGMSVTPSSLITIFGQYSCSVVSVVKISVDSMSSTLSILEGKGTTGVGITPTTISLTMYINQVNGYVFLPEKIKPSIIGFGAESVIVQANGEKTLASIKQEKINILK